MTKRVHWTAVCQYPGREAFKFYSSAFTVERWADLDATAAGLVAAEWARISPHPAPPVVELIPGLLIHMAGDGPNEGGV